VKKEALPIYLFSFFMIMPLHALFPLLPLIRNDLNASYSQISIFLASLGLVRLVLAYPSGYLADRFNQKKILFASGCLCFLGICFMSFAHTFFALILSRILIGFSSILCNITILSILAQIAGRRKGAMISMNNVVHNAAGIVSPGLAGLLAKWYSWRVSFLSIGLMVFISMLPIMIMLKGSKPVAKLSAEKKHDVADPAASEKISYWTFNLLLVFSLGFFVFFYRSYFRHTLLPFFGKDVFQIDVAQLGFYFSITAGIAMGIIMLMGHLSDRFGRKLILIPAMLLSGLAPLALLLPGPINPFLVCSVFVGLGAIINSMPNILISDFVSPDAFGRVLGINRMFSDGGYFLGTIVVGIFLDNFGFKIPLFGIAGYAFLMMLFMGVFIPKKRL
jgi:FSR family fosmidomycin resistance protein-like MFS transporter